VFKSPWGHVCVGPFLILARCGLYGGMGMGVGFAGGGNGKDRTLEWVVRGGGNGNGRTGNGGRTRTDRLLLQP
jgi:hypothetical protein